MLDTMILILKIYKHMKEYMAKKYIRIMVLEVEQKCFFEKLCKTNLSKDFIEVCLAKNMKESIIDYELYFRTQ